MSVSYFNSCHCFNYEWKHSNDCYFVVPVSYSINQILVPGRIILTLWCLINITTQRPLLLVHPKCVCVLTNVCHMYLICKIKTLDCVIETFTESCKLFLPHIIASIQWDISLTVTSFLVICFARTCVQKISPIIYGNVTELLKKLSNLTHGSIFCIYSNLYIPIGYIYRPVWRG